MKSINEIASDWQKQGHNKPAQASNTSIKKTSSTKLPSSPATTPVSSLSTQVTGEFNQGLKDVLRPYTVEQRKHIMAFFGKMQENLLHPVYSYVWL